MVALRCLCFSCSGLRRDLFVLLGVEAVAYLSHAGGEFSLVLRAAVFSPLTPVFALGLYVEVLLHFCVAA